MKSGFVSACVLCVTLVLPAHAAATDVDPKAEREAAVAAEQAGKWDAALQHYENIYDSTPATPPERVELRHKFEELRPKVAPNADPAKAAVYKVRSYVFRTTAVGSVTNRYNDKQIEDVKKATAAFAAELWKASLGTLRVEWDAVVIDAPLTQVAGCPDPGNCTPYFTDLKTNEMDFVMAYAITKGLPLNCWASTWGPACKGAMYTGFNDGGDGGTGGDGEVQIHEWIHALQMTLEGVQIYPAGLAVNPDSGIGNCGEKCWQPKPNEGTLYNWYRHMLTAHITRRMWRDLPVRSPANNAWVNYLNRCSEFLVIGPFSTADKGSNALDFAYIDEAAAAPAAGKETNGRRWQQAAFKARDLNFADLLSPADNQVAYVATLVQSDQEQPAQVRVGSDDSCKLWLNGKPILTEPRPRECGLDQNIVDVQMRKGENLVLMKVLNTGGDWLMNLRITDPKGGPLPHMRYALPGAAAQPPQQ